jgi:hypothetical protein
MLKNQLTTRRGVVLKKIHTIILSFSDIHTKPTERPPPEPMAEIASGHLQAVCPDARWESQIQA